MSVINQELTDRWAMYHGDCVDVIFQMPSDSVDFSVYSPPFASLYIYSDSIADMGNSANDQEFIEHYEFLAKELFRVLRPGRLAAVHCKDLVYYRTQRGVAGLRDFPGDLIRAHERTGWTYHSRITVWKCPVTEMQRTKAHGLLYKQLRADSSFSRQGLAEYVLIFRKWGEDDSELIKPVTHSRSEFPLDQWREWASPVWMDIQQTNVLNVKLARDDKDEKHICPLQLDLIERLIKLYSNPDEVILSPFAGIGSEGVVSLDTGRRFVGIELKDSYYQQAIRNLYEAESTDQLSLFGDA